MTKNPTAIATIPAPEAMSLPADDAVDEGVAAVVVRLEDEEESF
jgi:hypothetical protein